MSNGLGVGSMTKIFLEENWGFFFQGTKTKSA